MAITDRIIAYYSGGSTADELGVNTLTANGTSPGYVTGLIGDAFDCDATNETYWSIANASAGDFQMGTGSISWSFWFYCNALPAASAILIRFGGAAAGTPGYQSTLVSSGAIYTRIGDGTNFIQSNSAAGVISAGAWHHVRAVIDRGGFARCWVNGIQVSSASMAAAVGVDIQSSEDLRIGGQYSNYLDGLIDEVLFYDGCMSGDIGAVHQNGTTGNSYATLSAITRPFVSQEFIVEQETNTNNATAVVSDLVAGQVALVLLSTDGNATGASLTAWDAAWTNIIDATAPSTGTTFTRFRAWHKTVTSTDVSTETQVAASWTNNEKAVLVVQLWDNCAGVNAFNESSVTSSGTSFTEDGVTTDVDGCEILVGISIDGGPTVTASDAGLSFHDYQVTNASGHSGLWWGSESQATLGVTGTYAFTLSGTTHAVPFSIAMEPAAGGAPVDYPLSLLAMDAATAMDAASLSLVVQVTPAGMDAAATMDAVEIAFATVLALSPGAMDVATSIDGVTLAVLFGLAPGEMLASVTMDAAALAVQIGLSPGAFNSATTIEAVVISQGAVIVAAYPFIVSAESRVYAVPADTRLFTVDRTQER